MLFRCGLFVTLWCAACGQQSTLTNATHRLLSSANLLKSLSSRKQMKRPSGAALVAAAAVASTPSARAAFAKGAATALSAPVAAAAADLSASRSGGKSSFVFLHVPKTAGAAVKDSLKQYCAARKERGVKCCLGQNSAMAPDAGPKCDLLAAHVRYGVSASVAERRPLCVCRRGTRRERVRNAREPREDGRGLA